MAGTSPNLRTRLEQAACPPMDGLPIGWRLDVERFEPGETLEESLEVYLYPVELFSRTLYNGGFDTLTTDEQSTLLDAVLAGVRRKLMKKCRQVG